MEFRLAPRFKTNIKLFSVANDLFQNGALLVHLNGENVVIGTAKAIFFNGFAKAFINFFNTGIQNIWKTKKHWRGNITNRKILNQVIKIYFWPFVAQRLDRRMALFIDVKIVDSPPFNIVQLAGIIYAPFFHFYSILGREVNFAKR